MNISFLYKVCNSLFSEYMAPSRLIFSCVREAGRWLNVTQIKIAVKQGYDSLDSIIFEAAMMLNAAETRCKQKE